MRTETYGQLLVWIGVALMLVAAGHYLWRHL
jgi:hypothetical protein